MLDLVADRVFEGTGCPDEDERVGSPQKFQVVLHNETGRRLLCDITILMDVFNMAKRPAIRKAFEAKAQGKATVLIDSLDIAQTKWGQAETARVFHRQHNQMAEFFGFTLEPLN